MVNDMEIKMYKEWQGLELAIKNCQKCKLCKTRTNIVFGEGNKKAKLMIISEAPGYMEDQIGRPFVGKGGQLLDEVLNKVGIKREEIYIANIVKCRPPNNRDPQVDEVNACIDYLRNQVILIKPKIIMLLGNVALKTILGKEYFISSTRGQLIEKKNIIYLPSWHPAAILRDESKMISFINDFELAKNEIIKYKK